MDLQTILTIWGAIGTLASIIFGYVAFSRNKSKDDQAVGTILAELGYIKKGIEDMQHKVEKLEVNYFDALLRLTIVEQSVRGAHKRLDELGAKRGKGD